jgi:hypothetical protein
MNRCACMRANLDGRSSAKTAEHRSSAPEPTLMTNWALGSADFIVCQVTFRAECALGVLARLCAIGIILGYLDDFA